MQSKLALLVLPEHFSGKVHVIISVSNWASLDSATILAFQKRPKIVKGIQ